MASKHILKKNRRQAAVKVTGTGTATINIYELAYADQTVVAANVVLTITDVAFMTTAAGNVKRDGNVIIVMPSGSADQFSFAQDYGIVMDEKSGANVDIDLGATEGVVILQFSKVAGYDDPNRQNQGPGSL